MFGFKDVWPVGDVCVEDISIQRTTIMDAWRSIKSLSGLMADPLNLISTGITVLRGNSIAIGRLEEEKIPRKASYLLGLLFLASQAHAGYVVISLSTSSPVALQQAVVAATTAQFSTTSAGVQQTGTNPLVDYMIVTSSNKAYIPPINDQQLLAQMDKDAQYLATVDSYTYVYGYANGMTYQNQVDINITSGFAVNCSSPTAFGVPALDMGTCNNVTKSILNALYSVTLSTPPVLPFEP